MKNLEKKPTHNKFWKVLEYLDITIDHRQHGKVKFIMHNYIKKLLEELPADMQGTAKHLRPTTLNINQESKKINGGNT